ncbi:MAG TPA: hypothetical protein VH593_14330 [Ktedonobacteraceae bacterium]
MDLYSGAGGAARGYADAGFEVVGVDIVPQPHYPFEFHQGDALQVMDMLLAGKEWYGYTLDDFNALHGSPECKGYTDCNLSPIAFYERHIGDVRTRFQRSGKLYIIENVRGAVRKKHLHACLMLCATMFGRGMQRHRFFESNVMLYAPGQCDHRLGNIGIYGHSVWDYSLKGTPRKDGRNRPDSVPLAVGRAVMDCPWMGIEELAEALPPYYTEWIGRQLITALQREVEEVGA